jgi:hypothetical protein
MAIRASQALPVEVLVLIIKNLDDCKSGSGNDRLSTTTSPSSTFRQALLRFGSVNRKWRRATLASLDALPVWSEFPFFTPSNPSHSGKLLSPTIFLWDQDRLSLVSKLNVAKLAFLCHSPQASPPSPRSQFASPKTTILSIIEQLPVSQITHLELGSSTESAAAIIKLLPNLNHLTVVYTMASAHKINTLSRAPNFLNEHHLEHLKIVLKGPDSTVTQGMQSERHS